MLCWRNLFLELGGFDALYLPGYHEDIDLSWRAWKRGWCCWYEPESVVYHAGGSSMGRSEKVRVMQARNEFLFHWANLTVPRLVFRHGATLLPRLALAVVKRDRTRLLGFVQALSRCRQALQSRRRNRTLARLDDLQALQRIRDLQESPPVLPGGINIP